MLSPATLVESLISCAATEAVNSDSTTAKHKLCRKPETPDIDALYSAPFPTGKVNIAPKKKEPLPRQAGGALGSNEPRFRAEYYGVILPMYLPSPSGVASPSFFFVSPDSNCASQHMPSEA